MATNDHKKNEGVNQTDGIKPVWVDCKHIQSRYSLGVSTLRNLRLAGEIDSVTTRLPGRGRGKRLYRLASVEAYFNNKQEAARASVVAARKGGRRA